MKDEMIVETKRLSVLNNAVSLRRAAWLGRTLEKASSKFRFDVRPLGAAGTPDLADSETSQLLWDDVSSGKSDCALADLQHTVWPPPASVRVNAYLARVNPRYALLHRTGIRLTELTAESHLATSSQLARVQLASIKPDIEWVDLSGDLPARLHRLHLGQVDGVVEPASDLGALGFGEDTIEFLSTDAALPSPGQGVWIVCCNAEREDFHAAIEAMDDRKTRTCAQLECTFASHIAAPPEYVVGARAWMQTRRLTLDACIAPLDGSAIARLSISGDPDRPGELVSGLADMFHHQGVLRQSRAKSERIR
jgi:hydroxymethylbilane synthase